MARVLKGSHSFTCTHRVHPLTEWTIPAFSFPAEAGIFTDPGRMEGWVGRNCSSSYIRCHAEFQAITRNLFWWGIFPILSVLSFPSFSLPFSPFVSLSPASKWLFRKARIQLGDLGKRWRGRCRKGIVGVFRDQETCLVAANVVLFLLNEI